jgi:hypothetical protein
MLVGKGTLRFMSDSQWYLGAHLETGSIDPLLKPSIQKSKSVPSCTGFDSLCNAITPWAKMYILRS